jgi:hypothetical protein
VVADTLGVDQQILAARLRLLLADLAAYQSNPLGWIWIRLWPGFLVPPPTTVI